MLLNKKFKKYYYSSAHKNISDAIEAARLASQQARERVYAAQSKLYPRSGISVIDRARTSLEKSHILKKDAMLEIQDTEGKLWAFKARLCVLLIIFPNSFKGSP